jgi:hypothetical protein
MWCRRYEHGDCITEVSGAYDEYYNWLRSVEEPYDLEDLREHIRSEKLRISKLKVRPCAKPFKIRLWRKQNR